MLKLSKAEILRYKKQISLPAIGIKGQECILSTRVLLVGAGGLGAPSLLYLAAAGVGTIACIDFDQVELHNLHRQVIHSEQSVGQSKVASAALRLKQLNSSIRYIPIAEKLHAGNLDQYIPDYDIIIDGCDNFTTRYLVNDACVRHQKPLVYGSVLNFELQMAVFNHKGGKDLRAIFPEAPNPADVPSCELNGVMGTAPGILGLMMAQETLKIIIDRPCLHNQLLIMNTDSWSIRVLAF